jgi:universal stress protein A
VGILAPRQPDEDDMYTKALVAIELGSEPARQVLERARAFADRSLPGADSLWVVHVVEPQYVQYSFDPTFTGSLTRAMEQDAIATAARRVAALCAPWGIPSDRQAVLLGRPSDRIHEFARDHAFDLIILGSHGRDGLRAILGSTATATLHHAPVDVMTIRIRRSTPDHRTEEPRP